MIFKKGMLKVFFLQMLSLDNITPNMLDDFDRIQASHRVLV